MRIIINIVLLIMFAAGLFAQQSGYPVSKNLRFSAGYQNRLLLDLQKSALTYQSREFLAGIGFVRDGSRSEISFSVEGSMGNMNTRHLNARWLYITSYDINGTPEIDSFPVMARMISGKIGFSYLNKINRNRNVTWLAGLSISDYLAYPDNYTGLFNSLGIHLKAGMTASITGNSQLNANFSFPLLSLTTRLPWHNTATDPLAPELKTFFRKGTKLTGPDKFRMFEFNAEWIVKPGNHLSFGLAYNFTWLNITWHQPMRSFINSFKVQTAYRF